LKTGFKESFQRDLKTIRDRRLLTRIKEAIEIVESAQALSDIPNLKSLKGTKNYFRLRIGEHRIGIAFENQTVIFVRLLHRKEIYRYFP
jgi:mRNA interferase RelE/StbE